MKLNELENEIKKITTQIKELEEKKSELETQYYEESKKEKERQNPVVALAEIYVVW